MPKTFVCHFNPNFGDHFRRAVILSECDAVVAVVVPDALCSDITAALEFVFRHANTVDAPYWVAHRDCVTLFGDRSGARSLSAGDVVMTDAGEPWLCSSSG